MALLAAVWVVGAPVAGTDAQTTGEPRVDLDVSQRTDLVDGQVIDIAVTPAPGTTLVRGVTGQLRLCQRDASFTDGEGIGSPPQDLQSRRGKCPAFGSPFVSSDATRTGATLHPMPDGSRMLGSIRVGVGTTEPSEPGEVPLTCDHDNPCTLVAFAPISPGVWAADTVTLSFAPPDPAAAACGAGSAAGAISTIGPDRMSAANVAWTVAQCRATGDKKSSNFVAAAADTEDANAPAGEQRAVADLATGNRDLAYSAVGPGTPGFEPSTRRDVVAVPVAVNAMVVGLAGGYLVPDGTNDWPRRLPHPFHGVRLTADELASLFGRSLHSHFIPTYGEAVKARNVPQMEVSLNRTEGGGIIPTAYGGPHAGTRFFTDYLDTLAPNVWKASPTPGDGPDRGVYAKLSNVSPGFVNVIDTVSAMAGFEKAYFGVQEANNVFGPAYFLTDYATAQRLGLDLVSIQNADGDFVAPTPESITKGLSTMSEQPDGTLAPNPGESEAGAYPLTMVEYALAPAAPLVDAGRTCRRADSQTLLDEWLEFITGDGQAVIDNFVPLTDPLRAEAASAIADVGATAAPGTPTAACGSGPTPTNPTPPPTPAFPSPLPIGIPPSDLALGPGAGAGAGGLGAGGVGTVAGTSGAQQATAATAREAKEAAEEADVKIPPFMGIAAVSELISPLALLLIAVLTWMVAFGTSGRPVSVRSGVSRRLGRHRVPRAPSSRRGLARMLPRR